MSARITSSFFVAALIRRANGDRATAVLRRRGAAEAGAIFVKVDRLDGTADLHAPAAQSLAADDGGRRFERVMHARPHVEVEARLERELRFDGDVFIVEIEDSAGRAFIESA